MPILYRKKLHAVYPMLYKTVDALKQQKSNITS